MDGNQHLLLLNPANIPISITMYLRPLVVLIKRINQGRHKKGKLGMRVHSNQSQKSARAQREPWLLAVSPKLDHLSAQAVVAVYAQRMQIEESFRDLKSGRFGLGFSANRSTQRKRLSVLLLIGCLASFVLRLIGVVGKARQMEFEFQSNTRRSRPVPMRASPEPGLTAFG